MSLHWSALSALYASEVAMTSCNRFCLWIQCFVCYQFSVSVITCKLASEKLSVYTKALIMFRIIVCIVWFHLILHHVRDRFKNTDYLSSVGALQY